MNLSHNAISRPAEAFLTVVRPAVDEGHLPCALFAVANREGLLRCDTVGGPKPDSIFLLASVTKPIVATGILRLVEQGAISLHEPIANHWPEFAVNHKETVTPWHLLTHTSGLDEGYAQRQPKEGAPLPHGDVREIEARLVQETFLNFAPGSRYRYCNAGFRAIAALIERLSGRDYVEYLRAEVLAPLGMADTTFSPTGSQRERAMPVLDMPFSPGLFAALASPSGGYWSTAADLIRFGQMLLGKGQFQGNRVLGSATVAAATRVHYEGVNSDDPIQPAPVYRGLGFQVVGAGRAGLVPVGTFGHGGATGTYLWVDPHHDLVIVFLTNRWGQDSRWRQRAINAFYGALEE